MGRKRRAWLSNETGRRIERGRTLPGYCVEWREAGRHRRKTFAHKARARQFRDALNDRFELAGAEGLLPISLELASEEFLRSTGRLADSTREEMGTTLGRLAAVVSGTREVAAIDSEDIDRFLGKWESQIAESTLAKHWRYLRRFFKWCVKRKYCQSDPTADVTVKPAAGARQLATLPTEKHIEALITAVADDGLKVAALIGLTTGLDRGVVAALTPEHFNLDDRTITVQRQKTKRSNPVALSVPIHRDLLTPLARLLAETPPAQPLFPHYHYRAWYREAQEKTGAPWTSLTVGDFRKIASGRLQVVMPLTAVQKILGHSSPVTTATHYSPVDPATLQATDKLRLPSLGGKPQGKKQKRA